MLVQKIIVETHGSSVADLKPNQKQSKTFLQTQINIFASISLLNFTCIPNYVY